MKCPSCLYVAGRKDHLTRHIATKHSTLRPYRCLQCNKTYSRSDHLYRHQLGAHARTLGFQCNHCNKAFTRSDHLRVHREFVHDEGQHQCDICFSMRHSRIPFQQHTVCKACFKKATGRDSRVEHQWADFLKTNFDVPPMGEDQSLHAMGGCSKKRPDIIFSSPGLVICCECDEHWHRGHQRLCEEARMSEIAEELGKNATVVFLRLNPDGKGPPRPRRFQRFLQALHEICANPPQHPVSVTYLFYPPHAHNVATRWPATHILSV